MKSLRNVVRLIGRLGADPNYKEFTTGKGLSRVNLATSETYLKENGERVTETNWHSLVCWGKLAQTASKYWKKGQELAIEGKLTTRSYVDKDGVQKEKSEIVVSDFIFLGSKKNSSEVN